MVIVGCSVYQVSGGRFIFASTAVRLQITTMSYFCLELRPIEEPCPDMELRAPKSRYSHLPKFRKGQGKTACPFEMCLITLILHDEGRSPDCESYQHEILD